MKQIIDGTVMFDSREKPSSDSQVYDRTIFNQHRIITAKGSLGRKHLNQNY